MAQFDITAPSGQKFRINAPEGTSQDDALKYFQEQHPEMAAPQTTKAADAPADSFGSRFTSSLKTYGLPYDWPVQAGVGQAKGVADLAVGAGQMAEQWGGIPLSKWTPDIVKQGYDALGQRAGATPAGQVGEFIGSTAPFMLMPADAVPTLLGRVATRSTLPGLLQPVDDPSQNFGLQKLIQGGLSTFVGEGLQGLGRIGSWALKRQGVQNAIDAMNQWRKSIFEQQSKATRTSNEAAQRAAEDRAATVTRPIEATNTANEQLYQAALKQHGVEVAEQKALAAEENRKLAETYGALNRGEVNRAAGAQVGTYYAKQAQAAVPRKMMGDLYRQIGKLAGIGIPKDLTWQASTAMQDAVGKKLAALYQRMGVQANSPSLTRLFPALHDETAKALAGATPDPTILNRWDSLYRHFTIDPQAGTLSGDALFNYLKGIKKQIYALGQEAQNGQVFSGVMADGLRDMLHAVEDEADRFTPKLADQRNRLNMAYELASRVVEASDGGLNPIVSPGDMLKAWNRSQGDRLFGKDKRWVDHKNWLFGLRDQHEAKIPAATPPFIRPVPTVKPGEVTPPVKPDVIKPDPLLPPLPQERKMPGQPQTLKGPLDLAAPAPTLAQRGATELVRQQGGPISASLFREMLLRAQGDPTLARMLYGTGRIAPGAAAASGQIAADLMNQQ